MYEGHRFPLHHPRVEETTSDRLKKRVPHIQEDSLVHC